MRAWVKLEPNEIKRFFTKVKQKGNCWIWTGAKSKGYGLFRVNNKTNRAHRLSYELFKADIPQGMELDHLCRNPSCVNPEHLEPVTHKVNMLRGEGFASLNAKKTHCSKGHRFTGKRDKQGQRICPTCQNINNHKSRLKMEIKMKNEGLG